MENLRLFDSHTHLNSPVYTDDVEEVWKRSVCSGVDRAVIAGFDLDSSVIAINLSERLEGVFAAVGISPHDSLDAPEDYIERLRELTASPHVVAIGETGLEYHHPIGHHDTQQAVFRAHIMLACELGLPVIIHSRECDEDLLRILDELRPETGVLHCYTGGVETLRRALDLGMYISFSGIVTFPGGKDLRACVEATPEDRLLIETDCPYLAPVPKRGRRCEPSFLPYIAERVAEWKATSVSSIARRSRANADCLFGLSG